MIRFHSAILVYSERINKLAVNSISMLLPIILSSQSFFDLLFNSIINIFSEFFSSWKFFLTWNIFTLVDIILRFWLIESELFSFFFVLIWNVTSINNHLSVDSIFGLLIRPSVPNVITFKFYDLSCCIAHFWQFFFFFSLNSIFMFVLFLNFFIIFFIKVIMHNFRDNFALFYFIFAHQKNLLINLLISNLRIIRITIILVILI